MTMTIRQHVIPNGARLAGGTVLLFPGQGSQVADMRAEVSARCRPLLRMAEELVGADPFAGAEQSTRLLQPAIYCSSIAGWLRARQLEAGPAPTGHAGHSLGEIAALACAGAMSLEDGLRLAVLRGELMERAAATQPLGAMMAVLGTDDRLVRRLAADSGLTVAADNARGQVVLAGDRPLLARVEAGLDPDQSSCVTLAIRGAFHSPAMEAIRAPFEEAVREIALEAPAVPVYSSVTARPFDDIPRRLAESLTHPVRWRETLLALARDGAGRYLDVGPGEVLCRLVKRNLRGAPARAVATWDGHWTHITTHAKEAACSGGT